MNTQQPELFGTDEVETNEVPEKTTIADMIRELKSISVEVDIALDQVFDEDLESTKGTLVTLVLRIEKFLEDMHL